jgi:hypothetical protein
MSCDSQQSTGDTTSSSPKTHSGVSADGPHGGGADDDGAHKKRKFRRAAAGAQPAGTNRDQCPTP